MKIGVDQQNFFALLGQGQGQVGRHGGFALIFGHTGDQQYLAAAALGGVVHLGGQLFDLLGKVEAGARHGDQQALLIALQPGAEGLVLLLVVDGGEQPGIHLVAHGVGGLYGIGQYRHHQQRQGHARRADEEGTLHRAAQVQGIGGRTGHGGGVQLTQHHVLEHMLGHSVVVVQPEAQGAEGGDGVVRRDRQQQDVGLRYRGSLQPSGELLAAGPVGGQVAEHVAAEQAGEGAGDLGGGGQVGVQGGIAAVFYVDRHGGGGGILGLIKALHGGGGQQRRDQAHRQNGGQLHQHPADETDRAEVSPAECCLFFHYGILTPRSRTGWCYR